MMSTQVKCMSILLLFAVLPLVFILVLNDGTFRYSLDDAYIHLSLSEGISRFHYGINPGEVSSPSSSMLWPLLLAPFARSPVHEYVPLAFNLVCLILMQTVMRRLLEKTLPTSGALCVNTLAIGIICITNQIGLVYTGMEHTLHNLLCLVLLLKVIDQSSTGAVQRMLVLAIIALPLVRFEGLALSISACVVLMMQGKLRTGLLLLAATLLLLGACCLFLHSLGLPALPSSVLVKTSLDQSISTPFRYLTTRILEALENPRAIRLIIIWAILFAYIINKWKTKDCIFALFLFVPVTAHLLFGRYGWFARYDAYILLTSFTGGFWLFRRCIGKWFSSDGPVRKKVLSILLVAAVVCAPELRATVLTPMASNEIHRQHGSMRILVAESFNDDVIANDIGLISYRNENKIVDVAGLSCERARVAISCKETAWMDEICVENNVAMAVIYTRAYRDVIPGDWVHAASLILIGPLFVVPERSVDIYITDRDRAEEVYSALDRWEPTLPAGTELQLVSER